MTTDMDTLATALWVTIEDLLRAALGSAPDPPSDRDRPKRSISSAGCSGGNTPTVFMLSRDGTGACGAAEPVGDRQSQPFLGRQGRHDEIASALVQVAAHPASPGAPPKWPELIRCHELFLGIKEAHADRFKHRVPARQSSSDDGILSSSEIWRRLEQKSFEMGSCHA